MENMRLLLTFTLIFIVLMLYQAWQEDYGTKPPSTLGTPTSTLETPTSETPTVTSSANSESELPNPQDSQVGPVDLPTMQVKQLLPSESPITVETVYRN